MNPLNGTLRVFSLTAWKKAWKGKGKLWAERSWAWITVIATAGTQERQKTEEDR